MKAFDACAREYSAFRPNYPEELFDLLIDRSSTRTDSLIVDVGAGTGKGSAIMRKRGFKVVCVEPNLNMIQEGRAADAEAAYICASAEQTGIQSEAADLVTAAQSFHWFDPERALAEFDRILKPGCWFAAFWNTRDLEHPHQAEFEELILKYNPGHVCGYRRKGWAVVFSASGTFRVHDPEFFRFTQPMNIESWIGFSRSASYIRSLPQLPEFEQELREMLSRQRSLDAHYTTELWIAQKL